MIARITGVLESLDDGAAILRVGDLAYEVQVSVFTAARLGGSIGQSVTLQTMHYLESPNQGATFLPRLAGFLTPDDRDFFELFTTTKGIGNRKALRALALPVDQIAAAIADRDATLLRSLPEIGPRLADTIVATLHGKIERFLAPPSGGRGTGGGAATGTGTGGSGRSLAREALEVLVQLGETRSEALTWVNQALESGQGDPPRDVQSLLDRVYRLKQR